MTIEIFWEIIERVRKQSNGDFDARVDLLRENLSALPPAEILDFDRHFTELLDRAYSHDLWGGAYVMQGGCSDDGFWDFRSALISMGPKVFEQTLAEADSLAKLSEDEADILYCEGFQYVAGQVYEEKVGAMPERARPPPEGPSGRPFDSDDTESLRKRWPRTFQKYWDD